MTRILVACKGSGTRTYRESRRRPGNDGSVDSAPSAERMVGIKSFTTRSETTVPDARCNVDKRLGVRTVWGCIYNRIRKKASFTSSHDKESRMNLSDSKPNL